MDHMRDLVALHKNRTVFPVQTAVTKVTKGPQLMVPAHGLGSGLS